MQLDGTSRALYVEDGELQIGTAGKSAESYGAKAAFKVKGHEGQVSFQNVDCKAYLIFRGNTNGYNGDTGVMAEFTVPYCLWNIGKGTKLDDTYFMYSVRKDGTTAGSLVIMSATGKFDAYSSVEGCTEKFSNLFCFAEVEGEIAGIVNVNVSKTSEIYDLGGRRQHKAAGLHILNAQKFVK